MSNLEVVRVVVEVLSVAVGAALFLWRFGKTLIREHTVTRNQIEDNSNKVDGINTRLDTLNGSLQTHISHDQVEFTAIHQDLREIDGEMKRIQGRLGIPKDDNPFVPTPGGQT